MVQALSLWNWNVKVGGWTRPLPDGRELQLVPQIFNIRLSIGVPDADSYDDAW